MTFVNRCVRNMHAEQYKVVNTVHDHDKIAVFGCIVHVFETHNRKELAHMTK